MPGSSPEEAKVEGAEDVAGQVTTQAAETKSDVDASAESSAAEPKGQKGDLLDQVKAALKPKEKSPDSVIPGSPEEKSAEAAEKEGDEADDDSDDLTAEEHARLKPKTRKRIENLLKAREEHERKIAELEPQANQFQGLVRFVEDAGLSKDDVNQLFDVGKNLKQDPHKAYAQIKPVYEQLQRLVGAVLPDDLHQEVLLGRLTEAHARELAAARSRSVVAERRVQHVEQQSQTQKQQAAQQAIVGEVQGKVTEWERSKAASDPDWKLKQPRVMELIELDIVRRQRQQPNYFPTADEALAMANQALKTVDDGFAKLAPRRKAVTPITGDTSPRLVAAPKTALDAARQGLQQARAGT